ncbi:MAG: ORC1-type DNA replication protein [Methanofollis sp.]|uniref:ORC1-type DNA replication protein n=1 Tax=Methanofollis sp. TaxID=2052835 RepID=UPI00260F7A0F|nr:ORC1-type DNA replication protein [Methanofollis sp.]MDD4256098.1 ORC1-type DNA replication protein [Methanofollis sp.]
MTHRPLMSDQTLFRDPALFEITHLPEVFNYRDTQLEDLAFALRPALRGVRPLNTVLRGIPGTGKTTAVRLLFAEIEEMTQAVVPVLVSCQTERTEYAVFSRIFLALSGHLPPPSGVSNVRVMAGVAHALAERGAVLVVCLDDVTRLIADGTLDSVLAPLLRMHEAWPGVRTGVVLTLSTPEADLSRALGPSTLSVLQASEVLFPPYTAAEVRGILADRVKAGVYPGVVPPAVLDLVVERTMASGDLRIGLDLVKRAVLTAEKEARTEVTAGDVLSAFAVSRHLHLAVAVEALAPAERAVLHAVLREEREGGPAIAGRVYDRLCGEMGYAAFSERLRKLETLRLVDLYVRPGRGRTREVVVREGVGEVVAPQAGVAEEEECRYETGEG